MTDINKIVEGLYEKHYKKMLIIPAILTVIFLIIILFAPGLKLGIEFTGGTIITLRYDKEVSAEDIQSVLKNQFDLPDLSVTTTSSPDGYGALIRYSKNPTIKSAEDLLEQAERSLENETDSINYSKQAIELLGAKSGDYTAAKTALIDAQNALAQFKEEYSTKLKETLTKEFGTSGDLEFQIREVSPTLGQASLQTGIYIITLAIILVVLFVFIFFREVVPSLAIILCIIFDMLAGATVMTFLNIPLSLAAVTSLLMLIGYSIDTDIMLTHRMLNRKGIPPERRASESFKTGMTMTGTTLAALAGMLTISLIYNIDIVYQISSVLLGGLLGDLIGTWLMNAPIILWYVKRKEHK